ncbi:MAG: helix-turn-helix transcriptional regulator [Thermoplasmatales archaeon]|nr:helix-turn-helix transcriptional regulator [Thermoplasmatales archaeon]
MMDEIIAMGRVIRHPRRVRLLSIICRNGGVTAKEIIELYGEGLPSQYLYSDLGMMKESNLIERSFSEEKKCFVYKPHWEKVTVDFRTLTLDGGC